MKRLKRPRRLTRDQKILLRKLGYDPSAYLLAFDLDHSFVLRDKNTDATVVVNKDGAGHG